MADFVAFVVDWRACDTFLRPALCVVDLVMLRRTCRALRAAIVVGQGARPLEVLVLESRYYWLFVNYFSGTADDVSRRPLRFFPCSGRDFEAQKMLVNPQETSKMAKYGNIELLKWAESKGYELGSILYNSAVKGGQMEVIKWLQEKKVQINYIYNNALITAAKNGHLEVLKWVYNEKKLIKSEYLANSAALGGQLNVLKWLLEVVGIELNEEVCYSAAKGGHLAVLQWARDIGCPWDEYTCACAATRGYLEILKWARANGAPWNEYTCAWAAGGGHFEILQWARANGAPWDNSACELAVSYSKDHTILKWLREQGCPWDPLSTCQAAASENNFKALKWAIEEGGAECCRDIFVDPSTTSEEIQKWGLEKGILEWHDCVECFDECYGACDESCECWKKYCEKKWGPEI